MKVPARAERARCPTNARSELFGNAIPSEGGTENVSRPEDRRTASSSPSRWTPPHHRGPTGKFRNRPICGLADAWLCVAVWCPLTRLGSKKIAIYYRRSLHCSVRVQTSAYSVYGCHDAHTRTVPRTNKCPRAEGAKQYRGPCECPYSPTDRVEQVLRNLIILYLYISPFRVRVRDSDSATRLAS